MKKLIVFSVIFALLAGSVFAADGIDINAWGRGAFAPLIIQSKEKALGDDVKDSESVVTGGVGATWGGARPRVDFRINGANDYVGFTVASNGEDGSGLGTQDNGAHIWVKPLGDDMIKLTVGKFIDGSLRGKIGTVNGGFECFSLFGNNEEDQIFSWFAPWSGTKNHAGYAWEGQGFMLSSAPIEGLFIGFLVDGSMFSDWAGPGSGIKAADMYRYMQFGAGYNIDGIGHIRAQWIGGWLGTIDDDTWKDIEKKGYDDPYSFPDWCLNDDGDPYDWVGPQHLNHKLARIEAAFALTAVENLLVDLGAKIWLPLTYKDVCKVSNGIDVSVGAAFNADAFGITGRIDAKHLGAYHVRATEGDNKNSDPFLIDVRLTPTYDLDVVTLGVDLGFRMAAGAKDAKGDSTKVGNTTELGFGLFAKKGLPGGYLKGGLTYTIAPICTANDSEGKEKSGATGRGTFQIPIVLEYAFF